MCLPVRMYVCTNMYEAESARMLVLLETEAQATSQAVLRRSANGQQRLPITSLPVCRCV